MNERDIRPADLFQRYLELSAEDARMMFGDIDNRVVVSCPACGTDAVTAAFSKHSFRYVTCNSCSSLFVSPRPTASALDRFYQDSPSATYWADVFFAATEGARREKIFQPRVARILALLEQASLSPTTIIDVGAGYGLFLEEFRHQRPDAELLAIEPGAKLATVCRGKGFETLEVPVESASEWNGRGDLVVCFEVLEHVYSVEQFVSSLAALVAPGGLLVLSSLGVDGFDIQVLWERSKSVSPPHHLNFLSSRGFRELFGRLGFRHVDVVTPGVLDVDIVANAAREDPRCLAEQRFVRHLLESDPETRSKFQAFLVDARLSSHVWVLGRKE